MKFGESVMRKTDLVNSILKKNGARNLLENKIFRQNQARKFEDYVEYAVEVRGAVALNIIISPDSIQLGIDDMTEIFEWSNRQIDEGRNAVSEIIETVLTCRVEIKRCGSKYRQIQFFDQDGRCVRTSKYISGLYVPFFCKTERYRPILCHANLEG